MYLTWARFELATWVVIGTDCIGSCKSNYHTITPTTAPDFFISFYTKSAKNNTGTIRKHSCTYRMEPAYILIMWRIQWIITGNKYIITVVLNVETNIIINIAANLIGRAVKLVIMYVEISKTGIIVFISIKRHSVKSHWLMFSSISQSIDTDSITQRDEKKNVQFINKVVTIFSRTRW